MYIFYLQILFTLYNRQNYEITMMKQKHRVEIQDYLIRHSERHSTIKKSTSPINHPPKDVESKPETLVDYSSMDDKNKNSNFKSNPTRSESLSSEICNSICSLDYCNTLDDVDTEVELLTTLNENCLPTKDFKPGIIDNPDSTLTIRASTNNSESLASDSEITLSSNEKIQDKHKSNQEELSQSPNSEIMVDSIDSAPISPSMSPTCSSSTTTNGM